MEIPAQVTSSLWYKHTDQLTNGYYSLIEQSSDEFEGHSRYGTWIFDKNKLLICAEPDRCPNGSILCQRCQSASINMEEGRWYHIVSIYSGDALQIYINGELNSFRNYESKTGISVRPVSLTFGTDLYDPIPLYLKGLMDEVRLYNIALNADQVVELYNEFSSVDTDGKRLEAKAVIRPNPSKGYFYIDGDRVIKTKKLIAMDGSEIDLQSKNNVIDLRSYDSGMYFLQLWFENGSEIHRLVKL